MFVSGCSRPAKRLRDCDPGHADQFSRCLPRDKKAEFVSFEDLTRSRTVSEPGRAPNASRASIAQIDSVATAGKDVSSQPIWKQAALTLG